MKIDVENFRKIPLKKLKVIRTMKKKKRSKDGMRKTTADSDGVDGVIGNCRK